MPPEWTPHAATWTSWPFDNELWEGELEAVRGEFTALVATIARFEPVVLNVRDEDTERDARKRLEAQNAPLENITFHRLPLNDVWFRDNGPLFVEAAGQVALTDWGFNAWGEKYAPWDDDDRAPEAVAQNACDETVYGTGHYGRRVARTERAGRLFNHPELFALAATQPRPG